MTVDFERLAIFNLQSGAHKDAEAGLCAMEAVAWLEGLEHSDKPACTSLVIGAFVRAVNDWLPHDERQRLVAYLPRLVGTVSKPHEAARLRYLVLAAARVFLPIALRAVGLDAIAGGLAALPDDISYQSLRERCEVARSATSLVKKRAAAAYATAADATAAFTADAATAAATAAYADATAAFTAAYAAATATAAADAATAADADARARKLARAPIVELLFKTLDGLLAIGPAAPGFSTVVAERVQKYRELIGA